MRSISYLFIFLFFLSLTPLASAQTVSIGDYSTVVDSGLTVPINISDAESIAGGVVTISFDPAIVSVESVAPGDFGDPIANINNIDGWVKLIAARIDAVNKNEAVLANIVLKGFLPGQTNVDFTYASLNNETGLLIAPAVSSGSITITNDVVEHPYIHLKALSSRKTVDNINASHSIGIFNGQNKEDTFDLIVLNHNLSSVAALNQSSITIQPWESREVTLNVTDETPGEYFVSVKATSQSDVDVTDEVITKTIVQESFSINMSSLEGTLTSVGANITYLLTIQNNQKSLDSLTLSSSGIDPSWISFDTIHQLSAGEQKTIPIKITIPDIASAGSFTLTISATSSNVGTVRSSLLPFTIQNGPVISGLVPENNSHLGSNDVIFSWITNMNSTTKLILNQSGVDTVYKGDDGIYHNVIVENLTRNQWYIYRVISNTSHGSTRSDERSFYLDNGVSFTQKVYDFNIERDYDQIVAVNVKNTDSIAHEILLTVNSTNPELIVGFVGEGSIDESITLAPDEAKDIVLALHAQDTLQKDYYLLLNLTTDDNITDNAIANIHVRQPNIDLRLDELSTDPLTLTKTFRITNHGDTVTDLNIYESGGLKGNVTFAPIVTHGYLRSGRSMTFEAIPLLSLDFTEMEGSIVAEGAGVNTSFPVNYTLPDGKGVFYGSVPNVTIEFSDYFDNDNSPNTNPQEGVLVESYLTNGSLIFFSQIIVDVYQDGEPVSNANVTLKVWNSNGKTIILNGVSDFYGKALFAVFGKADDYSYKAIVDVYKVETETRNFSVNSLNLFQLNHNNITWLNISDSNSTFYNFNEPIILDNAPYIFSASKDTVSENEKFVLDLRWDLDKSKQIVILGSYIDGGIIFNTSGIPVGNYTATVVSSSYSIISLSETINISVTDINAIYEQNNYTFWVPFPVNDSYMTTLSINHTDLSSDSKIIFELNSIELNQYNKSEYLFRYFVMSNVTKNEIIDIEINTQKGVNNYSVPISMEANKPTLINVTIPINYTNREEHFRIKTSIAKAELQIDVAPKVHYIYEKRIWVGADKGPFEFFDLVKETSPVIWTCGSGIVMGGVKDVFTKKMELLDKAGRTGELYAFLVLAHWDVYDLSKAVINKDIDGVVLSSGSFVKKVANVAGKDTIIPSTFYSAIGCLKNWGEVNKLSESVGIIVKYSLQNLFCTNNPLVSARFTYPYTVKQSLSPTYNIENGYFISRFNLPHSRSSYTPQNIDFYINDVQVEKLENIIPEGHQIFRFDSSILNYADRGSATNKIILRKIRANSGHYIQLSDMQVVLPMKKMGIYVVANNQIEANEIINEMSSALSNRAELGIYSEDIRFSNPNPIADEEISINTTIFNFGTNGALFASLQILDNGVQLGENISLGFIPLMDSIPLNISWNPTPGTHNITVRVNPDGRIKEYDYSNNEASKTITVGISPDKTPPQSIADLNLQATGSTWLNWTWINPSDLDFNHTEIYLNGTFITNIPAPQNYYNATGLLPDTSYELSTRTVDTSGNINETWVNATTRTLPLADTTLPIITFTPPTDPDDTTLTTRNWTFINVSLSEPGYSWLEWNGINESMFGSGSHWYINKTGLDNCVYTYCVWANDSTGNVNVSETRAIEIDYVTDTLPPVITITSPVNDTTYNTDSVDLNYSVNEPTAWQGYSLDSTANITLDENTTLTDFTDGEHTLIVHANDTFGNMNSTTIRFTIDTTPPAGISNLQHTAGQTWINWSWLNPPDSDFNHTEIYLNGIFQTNKSAELFNATDLIPNTEYKISTMTADNLGNVNETWVNATARTLPTPDTTTPTITFISPTDPSGTTLTTCNWTFINVSLSEPGLSWIEWNGINESMSGSGTNWYINKTDLANDVYTYRVWANDTAGNDNFSETRTIEIAYVTDNLPPIISITSPINDTLYTTDSVELNYSVNVLTIWEGYSLDGADNITLSGNTTLFGLIDGSHILTIYANDTYINMNSSTVLFSIDTTSPLNISNLMHIAGTTHINWTWTNPSDPDFNHTELYLNGTFLTNIPAPQNYYNTTGLLPDTSYELSTCTVDTSGNINETWVNVTASTLPASGTTLNLYTGWNLISLPLMPENTGIASVLSPINGNYSIIWEYNASDTSDQWKKYDPSAPFGNDLTNMEPGKGYWIMMTSGDTLPISGTMPESNDIVLKADWNLIGYNSLGSQPVADALSSISSNYTIVWAYDASDTTDHWKKYDPGAPFGNDLNIIEPGKGYWIMMTSDDILET